MLDSRQTISRIWNRVDEYPWWKWLIIIIPVLAVTAILAIFYFWPGQTIDESLIKKNKKTVDKILDDHDKIDKLLIKDQKKLAKERKEIRKDLEKNYAESAEIIDRIQHADPSDIRKLAEELRERHREDIRDRASHR